jgi:hypothetical protein
MARYTSFLVAISAGASGNGAGNDSKQCNAPRDGRCNKSNSVYRNPGGFRIRDPEHFMLLLSNKYLV